MNKAQIINRGESLPLDSSDVVRINAKRGTVTQRHAWNDDIDGPVLARVFESSMKAAHALAESTGKMVELYSASGNLIAQVFPVGGTK